MSTKQMSADKARAILLKYSVYFMLVLLIIVATTLSPVFLSIGNIFNVLRQQAPYAMVALGILLTILTGGIDLSPGAVLAVANVVLAVAMKNWGLATSGGIWVSDAGGHSGRSCIRRIERCSDIISEAGAFYRNTGDDDDGKRMRVYGHGRFSGSSARR